VLRLNFASLKRARSFQIESAVKSAIKELVSSAVEKLPQRPDAEDGKSETLASKMRMLVFDDWIALLDQIFDNLLALLRSVGVARDVGFANTFPALK